METSLVERSMSSGDAGPRQSPPAQTKAADIFDQETFDATAYINEMFPTG